MKDKYIQQDKARAARSVKYHYGRSRLFLYRFIQARQRR